jgi:hypothetical protein
MIRETSTGTGVRRDRLHVKTFLGLELVRAIDGPEINFVGLRQRRHEPILHHFGPRSVTSGLEHRRQRRGREPRSERAQRLAQRRRMVAKVLDHGDCRPREQHLLPPPHPAKRA